MSWQLEEESKEKQEALSAALDRLNAGKSERKEPEELADLLETACWVRQSAEPPPQLFQETLDRLEAQALLPEPAAPEKSGVTMPKRRNWLYAGALGVAASVLLALQLLPSSPSPVAVAPEEAPRLAMRSETAPLVQKEEPSQMVVKEVKEEPPMRGELPPILAAAAEVVVEAEYKNGDTTVAGLGQRQGAAERNELAAAAKMEKTAELYMLRTVQLAEEETVPLVLPGEAADLVWHDKQKTIWRHVYRQDTPQEVAVTQWRPNQLQEKQALQRAAAVLGVNRLVLSREGRVLVLEGRGGERELGKVAETLALPEMER